MRKPTATRSDNTHSLSASLWRCDKTSPDHNHLECSEQETVLTEHTCNCTLLTLGANAVNESGQAG